MPRSSDATRKRLLETAYELFYRKGFARVGMDLIALKANVTKRTLYYHFESKDALLAAVLEFHTTSRWIGSGAGRSACRATPMQ